MTADARDALLRFLDRIPAHEHVDGRMYFSDCAACAIILRGAERGVRPW